jgi:leucine-rich repeat protein SHOC2
MSATTAALARLIDRIAPNSTVLDLRGCGLEALPENIGDLTYLTKLNLNGNRLTSLPESIGNLTNLTELYLNGHKLINLPESICNLTNLTRLDLNGGYLRCLPDSIVNLINLTELKLSNNQFDRNPDVVFDLPNLKKVNLDGNPLTDLSNLKNIPNLKISRSYSRSKFQVIKLKNSVRLVVGDRYLVEGILSNLKSFTNLVSLGLGGYGSRILEHGDTHQVLSVKEIERVLLHLGKLPKLYLLTWHLNLFAYHSTIQSSSNSYNISFCGIFLYRFQFYDLNSLRQLNVLESVWTNLSILCQMPNLESICYIGLSHRTLLRNIKNIDIISNLTSLKTLGIYGSITDLSIFTKIKKLETLYFNNVYLPRQYWAKLSEWKPEWLLNENNAERRRMIIERLGYENICEQLNAINLDNWREYTLLKIDNFQPVFEYSQPSGREPIALLKMTCPSTGHVHILRVPPEMTSAEDAIVWVNRGIHPDRFTIQT